VGRSFIINRLSTVSDDKQLPTDSVAWLLSILLAYDESATGFSIFQLCRLYDSIISVDDDGIRLTYNPLVQFRKYRKRNVPKRYIYIFVDNRYNGRVIIRHSRSKRKPFSRRSIIRPRRSSFPFSEYVAAARFVASEFARARAVSVVPAERFAYTFRTVYNESDAQTRNERHSGRRKRTKRRRRN